MTKNYKALICQRSTGHVLNTDATSVFTGSELPFIYFGSAAEAENFAEILLAESNEVEVVLYEGNAFCSYFTASR